MKHQKAMESSGIFTVKYTLKCIGIYDRILKLMRNGNNEARLAGFGLRVSIAGDKMTPDFFMREALKEAEKAFAMGEVPIGAVVERNGEIIGRGHNRTETWKDPTAHAEIIAIRQAAETLGGWRLLNSNLYVTTEPCSMCAGAIVLARIETVYIGTMDPKAGACGSLMNILQDERLNHNAEIRTGILEQECRQLMKDFFRNLRQQKKLTETTWTHQEEQ
jgi:tRNA(adenine34) deaminase